MEGLTRLVTESMARHGFDRPLDYRRLRWSRWFRCESHHSLLFVPSKPGVFALAEEIMDLDTAHGSTPPDLYQGMASAMASNAAGRLAASAAEDRNARAPRRMLAVTQFFEDDDMAFVLDRMLSRENSMRARLNSGRYFIRYVVIEDAGQRRSICNALDGQCSGKSQRYWIAFRQFAGIDVGHRICACRRGAKGGTEEGYSADAVRRRGRCGADTLVPQSERHRTLGRRQRSRCIAVSVRLLTGFEIRIRARLQVCHTRFDERRKRGL